MSDERRGGPRLDLRLSVSFLDDESLPQAEATDISPTGARLESRVPLDSGTTIRVALGTGDGETVEAVCKVAWCRPRKSVSTRKLYDVGVSFEGEWLSQKRGKLGRALGRIFSFSEFEPARAFERVLTTLRAESVDGEDLRLTVVDISEGGMQLRAEEPLSFKLTIGSAVVVELPSPTEVLTLDGEIAWVAEQDGPGHALYPSFGVRFGDPGVKELEALQSIKNGIYVPSRVSLFLPKR